MFAASLASAAPAVAQNTGAGAPSHQGRMKRLDPLVLKGPPAPMHLPKLPI
jgi:hypothetical protein